MKLADLKKMDVKDLHKELAEARTKLTSLRFGVVNRQVKNVRELRVLRTTVARIKTLLNDVAKKQSSERAAK